MPEPKPQIVELDDDNENWLREVRLEALRERGWQGTLKDWMQAVRKTGVDPLTLDPPVTR